MTSNHGSEADLPPVGARILVVDDDPKIRQILTTILQGAEYDAQGVGSAHEARAVLRDGGVDLLLTDVRMAGQSGLELIRFALAEHTETATLLISGADDPEVARVGMEYGAYGYLAKPFSRNEILISVMNA